MKVSELIEAHFTLGSKQHAQAIANATGKGPKTIKMLKKAVRGSTMSAHDEEAVMDALIGIPDEKQVKRDDLEQISAIADVDLGELLDLMDLR